LPGLDLLLLIWMRSPLAGRQQGVEFF